MPGRFLLKRQRNRVIYFVWDAVPTATNYQFQIGTTEGESDYMDVNVGNVLTYGINTEFLDGIYYCRTVAYNGVTFISATADQVITV